MRMDSAKTIETPIAEINGARIPSSFFADDGMQQARLVQERIPETSMEAISAGAKYQPQSWTRSVLRGLGKFKYISK